VVVVRSRYAAEAAVLLLLLTADCCSRASSGAHAGRSFAFAVRALAGEKHTSNYLTPGQYKLGAALQACARKKATPHGTRPCLRRRRPDPLVPPPSAPRPALLSLPQLRKRIRA
jgi:hypothetical protein